MRYGIINAEQTEMTALVAAMVDDHVSTIAGKVFHHGKIGHVDVVVVNGGIGKVAAALTTTLLITNFGVDRLINSGSAGALDDHLQVGDIVIAQSLAYFDADAQTFGYTFGQVPQQPARFITDVELSEGLGRAYQSEQAKVVHGLIVSGDTFIDSQEKRMAIKQHFSDGLSGEMEGAAVAQIAHHFDVPFTVVRAISDNANGDAGVSYDEFVIQAGQQSAQVLIDFFNQK
ncbi:5'-methylthioadenosine/adenosylhomocysteine nucleosidase [Weissella diestrammenae]|uniref:adenosylhomocysteine nucleosidase n=1 Tax=Weissella diestrammenae TaxID=1162633 RepID=A0A7G9T651_9LACO|nr:5'-methylthioadenosine/adenosylhomocysteine nucleosidase [Weissella diestrammenae]MCM0582416.1 5'-methylthioadenosine/adenosylhomocysteine nucleosidase [Weissella diestrammenae]QNN75576.1 5'-methylthioadenosine/adenosylhomocysteine nucleosidase [Weissella diestrammenae]